VYNFKDLRVLNQIATCSNPLGLCSLNTENMENIIIACPDKVYGGVNIHFYDDKKNHSIQAHQSPLQCLELNSKVIQNFWSKKFIIIVMSNNH